MKKQLIETGQISEKKFKKQHKNNEQETKKQWYNKLDKQILELVKKGVTPLEIATCLNLRRQFVYKRQKEIFKEKKITRENILEFRKKRAELFSNARIKAKKEMDEDSNTMSSRKNFFELAKAEVSYGNNLQKADIEMLGRCIILNDGFLTRDNLKLVIMQYIKLGNYKEVNKYINTLTMLYEETEYGKALKSFNRLAREKLVLSKIKNADTQKKEEDEEDIGK